MLRRLLLIILILIPISVIIEQNGFSHSFYAHAAEETVNDEGGDVLEGEDEANVAEDVPESDLLKTGDDEEDESEAVQLKPSADVDTYFLITKPTGMGLELPAGREIHFLVAFANKGTKEFTIETMDASFRYAQDFSFHLQNFTAIAYNRVVKPQQEATLAYQFFVSEAYSTRPYGFTVNLFYKDAEGNQYLNAVFNETVSIVELDEGLDGETFFLYVFLVAVVILLAVAGQQFFVSFRRKRSLASKLKPEMGTSNPNDVDYDWLPAETLNSLSKSPKVRQSPGRRRVKRGTGFADD